MRPAGPIRRSAFAACQMRAAQPAPAGMPRRARSRYTHPMSRIDTFEAMLARGPDNEMLRFSLGNAYLAEDRPSEAGKHLARAVELKPDYSAAWKQLGRALAASGEPNAALEAFESGRRAAESNGDKQTAKEIAVFSRRVRRQLAEQEPPGSP